MGEAWEVEAELKVKDHASSQLHKLAGLAERVGEKFKHVALAMTGLGAIGAGFEIGEAVSELQEKYRAIDRIKTITGESATNAYAMVDAMDKVGIGTQEAERILLGLSRKSQSFADGLNGAGVSAREIADDYARMGVTAKEPTEQLIQMSAYAEKHRLDIAEVQKLYGVTGQKAADLIRLLEQGPTALREHLEEAKKSGAVIDADALARFQQMEAAKRGMKSAFEDLVGTVYKNIAPAMTQVFQFVTREIQKWSPVVERMASYLEKHMSQIADWAKKFVTYIAANKLVSLLTGKGIGSVLGGLGKAFTGVKATGPLTGATPAETAFNVYNQLKSGIGQVGTGIFKVISPLNLLVAGFGILAAKSPALRHALGTLAETVGRVAETVGRALAPVVEFVGNVLAKVVDAINSAFTWIESKADELGEHFYHGTEKMNEAARKAGVVLSPTGQTEAQFLKGAGFKTPGERQKPEVVNDFRGSHIEMHQKFDEGMDPDRIAAATISGLTRAGEQRVMSQGLAPIFSST